MKILPVEERNGGWESARSRRLPSVGRGKTALNHIALFAWLACGPTSRADVPVKTL
jgi:hypothetical protein